MVELYESSSIRSNTQVPRNNTLDREVSILLDI